MLMAAVFAQAEIRLPPFPQNLDLSKVERLYKSAAYRVDVKSAREPDAAYRPAFIFETRDGCRQSCSLSPWPI